MQRNEQRMQRKWRNIGPMLVMSLLLTSCAASQGASVIPDYSPEFLEALAIQYETRTYGDETARAIDDLVTIIDQP